MNFSSAALAWTNTTSASPRRAMSSAWPVPSATTRTWIPVFFSNSGSRCLNSPDCSVEVVEATVMKFCASATRRDAQAPAADNTRRTNPLRFNSMAVLL